MNKLLQVIRNRLKNRRELKRELLSFQYLPFNLWVTHHYQKQFRLQEEQINKLFIKEVY